MNWQLQWMDSVPSTNTYLRDLAAADATLPAGTVIAAREQTGGRGRAGRQWMAAKNRDLTFSALLQEETPSDWAPSLPMAAALAVASFLDEFGLDGRVKWPNDVRVGGRKICGILAENVPGISGAIVLGIGVNINMSSEVADAIIPPATSLYRERGKTETVDTCLERLLPQLDERLARWRRGGFEGIRDEWMTRCEFVGERVAIVRDTNSLEGTLRGFDAHGALELLDDAGHIQRITVGDVSLRGGAV